ncbi:MAG TPA: DNA-processing protein DprA, partial [Fimbriimonas sp.]|nr:DNA-processing protein DprA [Fimbriimonas sp.]
MKSVLASLDVAGVVLAALYLRGGPGGAAARRKWPLVECALRRSCDDLGRASNALLKEGLWAEAVLLERPGLLAWAERQISSRRVISVLDSSYPLRWRRLGPAAPPVLWRVGEVPEGPFCAVVGSRRVGADELSFSGEVAAEASALGYAIVSGGAPGCDSAALQDVKVALEILPYGIEHHRRDRAALSLCPPGEPFSTSAAMERNALIYCAASHAVVVHARFREGGTWTGA